MPLPMNRKTGFIIKTIFIIIFRPVYQQNAEKLIQQKNTVTLEYLKSNPIAYSFTVQDLESRIIIRFWLLYIH